MEGEMAKGEQRGNREAKKPKQKKAPAPIAGASKSLTSSPPPPGMAKKPQGR
jgi:hypothetical protein